MTARMQKIKSDWDGWFAVFLRRVRTEEAKAIRRRTGTNPFQAKRMEVAPYDYAPTVTCTPSLDNLLLVEYKE